MVARGQEFVGWELAHYGRPLGAWVKGGFEMLWPCDVYPKLSLCCADGLHHTGAPGEERGGRVLRELAGSRATTLSADGRDGCGSIAVGFRGKTFGATGNNPGQNRDPVIRALVLPTNAPSRDPFATWRAVSIDARSTVVAGRLP